MEGDGHTVKLFDGTLKNAEKDDYLQVIQGFDPDLIAISVFSRGHNMAKRLVALIKENYHVPVVIGGPQVTALPELVLKDIGADFAVVGEGEITLSELAKYLSYGKKEFFNINGLAFFDTDKRVILNKPRDLIGDLDTLPFPAWEHMPPSEYRIVPILATAKRYPLAPIMTSRGCPFHCTFCASNITWKHRIRFRSPQNVVDEMKKLKFEFGVREFLITDDNFTLDTKFATSVCKKIIESDIDITWQCSNGVRVDSLNPDLLSLMKKSGCYSVGLGIESGNQGILNNAKKSLDLSVVKDSLLQLKQAGIKSYGFFIFGFPGETAKTAQETISFAVNNSFDRAWFNIMTPYPGAELFDRWIKNKSFEDIDWDSHDGSTADLDWCELSSRELEAFQWLAAKKFYLRPRIILDIICHLSIRQVLTLFMTRFFRKRSKGIFGLVHSMKRKDGRNGE